MTLTDLIEQGLIHGPHYLWRCPCSSCTWARRLLKRKGLGLLKGLARVSGRDWGPSAASAPCTLDPAVWLEPSAEDLREILWAEHVFGKLPKM
jgi:hypothetical protein